MKTFLLCLGLMIGMGSLWAQVTNTATMDTADTQRGGKVTVGGCVDAYYGYYSNQTVNGNVPYFVSMARQNEASLNLAYIDIKYNSERIRARFVPGVGSYMNSNYANEPFTFKHVVEGNAGIKLFKNKEIWVDFGVLGSPYTNESAISKDHLMYTRSFAPEYVPYYLSGLKVSLPISKKWTGYVYLLNGWQVIVDNNKHKSLGTQLEYRPNDKMLFNWNTYIGNERTTATPFDRMRYFTDLYWIYNPNGKLTATACAYIGVQQRIINGATANHVWGNANAIVRYRFAKDWSLSGRVEYFHDPHSVQITPITSTTSGFRALGGGFCFNYHLTDNAMIRLEGRSIYTLDAAFLDANSLPTQWAAWGVGNITVWF